MSKNRRYFFDREAVRENDGGKASGNVARRHRSEYGGALNHSGHSGFSVPWKPGGGRNVRTVWTLATQPYKEAHFAVFPEKLIEPCIKAGTSEKGCCPKCGTPWVRVIERKRYGDWHPDPEHKNRGAVNRMAKWANQGPHSSGRRMVENTRRARKAGAAHNQPFQSPVTIGWKPSCTCNAGDPVPCVVLDTFIGSGTTAVVARRLGRNFIGIDLNPDYVKMAKRRIQKALGGDHARTP